MTKIKIINKERELEGSIKEARVMPFGTSSHIITSKEDIGKKVYLVIPHKAGYFWVQTNKDFDNFIKQCDIAITERVSDKMQQYYVNILNNIKKDNIDIDDFYKLVEILPNNLPLKKKLLSLYAELR